MPPHVGVLANRRVYHFIDVVFLETSLELLGYLTEHRALYRSCFVSKFDVENGRLNSLFVDEGSHGTYKQNSTTDDKILHPHKYIFDFIVNRFAPPLISSDDRRRSRFNLLNRPFSFQLLLVLTR